MTGMRLFDRAPRTVGPPSVADASGVGNQPIVMMSWSSSSVRTGSHWTCGRATRRSVPTGAVTSSACTGKPLPAAGATGAAAPGISPRAETPQSATPSMSWFVDTSRRKSGGVRPSRSASCPSRAAREAAFSFSAFATRPSRWRRSVACAAFRAERVLSDASCPVRSG